MKKRRGSVGDGGYLCKALKSRGRKLNCLWKGGVCNVNDDAQRCGSVSLAGFTRYLLFIIHFLLLLSCHSLCWRWSTKSPRSHNLLSLVLRGQSEGVGAEKTCWVTAVWPFSPPPPPPHFHDLALLKRCTLFLQPKRKVPLQRPAKLSLRSTGLMTSQATITQNVYLGTRGGQEQSTSTVLLYSRGIFHLYLRTFCFYTLRLHTNVCISTTYMFVECIVKNSVKSFFFISVIVAWRGAKKNNVAVWFNIKWVIFLEGHYFIVSQLWGRSLVCFLSKQIAIVCVS